MKKIRFFKQHSLETCAISCLLMTLDYFGLDFPTTSKEMQLYHMYGSKVTPGTPAAAVAYALCRRGLKVELVHSSAALLENQGDYYPPQTYQAILKEYRSYIARSGTSLILKTDVPVTCDALRGELAQDRLLIVQCYIEGDADGVHDHVPHAILLYDADGDSFCACDPLSGKIRLTGDQLDTYMTSPLGRLYLSVGR